MTINVSASRCCILFIWLLTHTCLAANKPNVVNFSRNQYQAANKNWSIGQDSFGIMYFGNDKGLLEFDGIRWKLYSLPRAEIVRSVAVSPDNIIYTGGYEEFGKWERDISGSLNYTSISLDLKKKGLLINDDIWRILVKDNLVYFQSFKHIFVYDQKEIKLVDTSKFGILFLIKVYEDFFVQKIGGSLYKLVDNRLEEIIESRFLKDTEVRIILPYANHQYLIGTSNHGLYIFDGKTFTAWDSEFSKLIKPYELNNGILRNNGNYYFGTIINGAYEVSPSGVVINHFSTNNLIQNNTVLSLFEDNSNNIWSALDKGITYIQYLRDIDCYIDHSGKLGAIYAAALYNDKLFLGTNQGLFHLPQKNLTELNSLSGVQAIEDIQGQVWDLSMVNGQLFCGHNKGLKIINKDMSTSSVEKIESGVFKINKIRNDKEEFLFLGTYTHPTILMNNKEPDILKKIEAPTAFITKDHLGNFWLEYMQKGVFRYRSDNGKELETFGGNSEDGLPYHLRLFKLGGQIILIGNDTVFTYSDIEHKIIYHKYLTTFFSQIKSPKTIIPLPENSFLIVCNNCLYKIYYNGYDAKIIDYFDFGYNNISLVNNYENAILLNDSLCLICLDSGFLLHNINKESQSKISHRIPYLRSLACITRKGEKKYLAFNDKRIDIPFNQNTLLFDFFSEHVIDQNLSFQYQLKNVNADWSSPAKINEALFERLPEGNYVFLLRTIDNMGNCSEPLSITFRVLPPWYLSVWAYIGFFIVFIITMTGIWFTILKRYRNAHLLKVRRRETQRLQRQNKNLQKELESKNAELFAQTSFIIQKNELITKVKKEIDNFYTSYPGNKILKPFYEKVEGLLSRNMDIDEDWKMFLLQFEQKHTGFFKKMKELEPELTPNDLKLCACLKLNLNSKDIASLLNISLRGVENNRYRLRKKLRIPPNQNLNDYFMQI